MGQGRIIGFIGTPGNLIFGILRKEIVMPGTAGSCREGDVHFSHAWTGGLEPGAGGTWARGEGTGSFGQAGRGKGNLAKA